MVHTSKRKEEDYGQVSSVSNAQQPFGSVPFGQPQTVDITVKCGDTHTNYQKLNSLSSVATTNADGVIVVISDSRDQMIEEVSAMKHASEQTIASIDYHRSVLESCEEMMNQLNPQLAKEKAHEDRLDKLENGFTEIKDLLVSILETQKKKAV